MKTITFSLLIVCLIFFSCSENPTSPTTRKKNIDDEIMTVAQKGLKGNVKSISTYSYLLENEAKDSLDRIIDMDTYTFNKQGYVIEFRSIASLKDSANPNNFKGIYKYNNENKLIEYIAYSPLDSISQIMTYQYDSIGNLVKEIAKAPNDSIKRISIYSYDSKGDETEIKTLTINGTDTNRHITSYQYNNKGMYASVTQAENGRLLFKNVFSYDNKGNQIEIKRYKSEDSIESILYTKYNEKNEETENEMYNQNGQIISKNTFANIKYDNHGNWIEGKSVSENNNSKYNTKITYITKQQIAYY